MAKKERQAVKVAVIDLETDPFKFGRVPEPFAAGFYDGERYIDFWGDNCVNLLMDFLSAQETPYLIYAHNGGKFDFFFFFSALENPIKIINGRIVQAAFGIHKFRDSYAIIPIPLKAYAKEDIDYSCMERDVREKHKPDILHYLAKDCEYLYQLVSAFRERFNDGLTIGGTAIKELQKFHPFARQQESHDDKFRPFYYGGRVQAFKTGVLKGKYKIYDVNSMYPSVMRNSLHPTGRFYSRAANPKVTSSGDLFGFGKRFYFIHVSGRNSGAFPVRLKTGLDFTVERGEFFTTSHELKAALACGLFKIEKIHAAWVPHQQITFGDYVDTYMQEKIDAKISGDKIKEIFSKLLLNSAYGKFGQNPDNYYDYTLVREVSETPQGIEWELYEIHGDISIWRKKSESKSYFDVATAASITSASRALLLGALAVAKNPIYCDTDSIICEDFTGEIHDTKLGAWKFEGEADTVAIAGKKLYAAFKNGECFKLASKGVRLSPTDILSLCQGENVSWQNMAPSFSIANGKPKFVSRVLTSKIKRG